VFLAGDAAHLMSPCGARRRRCGWTATSPSGAPPRTPRRHRGDHALHGARDPLRRLARNAVLRGSLRLPRLRRFVSSGKLAEPFTYAHSPVVLPPAEGGGAAGAGHTDPGAALARARALRPFVR
jgi:hypothetical protein